MVRAQVWPGDGHLYVITIIHSRCLVEYCLRFIQCSHIGQNYSGFKLKGLRAQDGPEDKDQGHSSLQSTLPCIHDQNLGVVDVHPCLS